MNADHSIRSALGKVTREDLEGSVFAAPRVQDILGHMNSVHVSRLSRFWETEAGQDRGLIHAALCDYVTGMYGQQQPWLFFLEGRKTSIRCSYGLPKSSWPAQDIKTRLRSVLPDVRFDDGPGAGSHNPVVYKYAAVLTGIPSIRAGENDEQIERLCRGLWGEEWLYLVYARPVDPREVGAELERLNQEISDVHAAYLLKESAADQSNRQAQSLIELLEKNRERLMLGRSAGMWVADVFLAAKTPEVLERGRGLLHSAFNGPESLPVPVRTGSCSVSSSNAPPPEPLNTSEIAVLARPPAESYPGFEVVDYQRFGISPPVHSDGGATICIGEIHDRGTGTQNPFNIPVGDVTKHGLIAGVTGSGKTNTCRVILDQAWNGGKGVPFLVIESAKSEYRDLLANRRFKGLNVFTIGDETISPLRLNPFEVPKGILVQTHIDYLKSLFAAAFVLYPPMPYILEICLQRIYENKGWRLSANVNPRGAESDRAFPTLTDLANLIPQVVEESGYDARLTMDVKAGLLARITQLRIGGGKGPMLDTRRSIPDDVLFESPCVLELKALVSDDEKAFLMGLILIRLYEYCETKRGTATAGLRHMTLIEEAHRLLRNVSMEQGGEVTANPRGKAIEVFSNILSEIRAFGEGVLIAEQVPVKLTPDALKNTNLKVVHRIVSRDDREAVGGTMNLTPERTLSMSTMSLGEGLVYAEGMEQPALVKVDRFTAGTPGAAVSDEELRRSMRRFWDDHKQIKHRYDGCVRCADETSFCAARDESGDAANLRDAAFRHLFNAMRLNKPLVVETFLSFDHICRREPGAGYGRFSTYCHFVRSVETGIEKRGEFSGWEFDEIDELIELACSIVWTLSNDIRDKSRENAEKNIQPGLRKFSNLIERMYRTDTRPFNGCRFCEVPCQYRYEMCYERNSWEAKQFGNIFFAENFMENDWDRLGRHCINVAGTWFHRKDVRSTRSAAVCFAVQEFARTGMSPDNQENMAGMAATVIEAAGK